MKSKLKVKVSITSFHFQTLTTELLINNYLGYNSACAGIMLFLLSVLGGDWMHVPCAQCSTTK